MGSVVLSAWQNDLSLVLEIPGSPPAQQVQPKSTLILYPANYSIGIFTHLKLCLADAIHNFKWVKIIQI